MTTDLSAHQAVFDILAAHPHRAQGGLDIMKAANLGSTAVYVALARLEHDGWVHCEWETPQPVGRPSRRLYRLSEKGLMAAHAYLRPSDVPPIRWHMSRWWDIHKPAVFTLVALCTMIAVGLYLLAHNG